MSSKLTFSTEEVTLLEKEVALLQKKYLQLQHTVRKIPVHKKLQQTPEKEFAVFMDCMMRLDQKKQTEEGFQLAILIIKLLHQDAVQINSRFQDKRFLKFLINILETGSTQKHSFDGRTFTLLKRASTIGGASNPLFKKVEINSTHFSFFKKKISPATIYFSLLSPEDNFVKVFVDIFTHEFEHTYQVPDNLKDRLLSKHALLTFIKSIAVIIKLITIFSLIPLFIQYRFNPEILSPIIDLLMLFILAGLLTFWVKSIVMDESTTVLNEVAARMTPRFSLFPFVPLKEISRSILAFTHRKSSTNKLMDFIHSLKPDGYNIHPQRGRAKMRSAFHSLLRLISLGVKPDEAAGLVYRSRWDKKKQQYDQLQNEVEKRMALLKLPLHKNSYALIEKSYLLRYEKSRYLTLTFFYNHLLELYRKTKGHASLLDNS